MLSPAYNKPITDTKQMGGAGFESATNEYSMRGHGELCLDVSISGPTPNEWGGRDLIV